MEVKIPEPKYKVETVTLEEIDKRDEHNKLKAGLPAYRLHSRNIRAGNVHMNGVPAAPRQHWPANGATRW